MDLQICAPPSPTETKARTRRSFSRRSPSIEGPSTTASIAESSPINQSSDASEPLQALLKRVFSTGLLSEEDEVNLRILMAQPYCKQTFRLLISLQSAAQSGHIVQISRRS